MTSITNAHLEWNEAGTPVSEQFDDVYFSNVNGLEETRYVFLKQNHLPERWQTHTQRRFVIAETGFGTGLNFLAVWQWFENFRAENPDAPLKELHFISFEKFPLNIDDLRKAHLAWPELKGYAQHLQQQYPIAVPECHRLVFAGGAITLDLWFGDIKDCMPTVPTSERGIVDAWFLDGFAPSKNPEMWNQELFNGMAKLAKKECTCATFTAAGFVRRGLIEAGFTMKKVKGFGTKRDMIVGTMTEKHPYTNILPWYARPGSNDIKDVAVIGGGIASAALAATLGRRGIKTTIYCEDTEAAGNASGNEQGALYPLLNGTHSGPSRVFAPAFLFARQFFDQMAGQFDYDHDWCGVTHLAWSEKAGQKLDRILEGNFDPTLVAKLTPKEIDEKVGLPIGVTGSVYPMGGWLCPREFTQKLMGHLQEEGLLEVVYNTEIRQLSQKDDKQWLLSSEDGEFRHQTVVIANGHKFNQFEQAAHIPASAVKGQVSHIPTSEKLKQLQTVLCYNGYMTPYNPNNGHHCIGASHDRKHIDFLFDEQAQIENAEKLRRSIQDQEWVGDVDVSENKARQGIRCTSRDHLPFVGNLCDFHTVGQDYANLSKEKENAGPIASYENLYCLLALGGRGLCSTPLMAEVLASQICTDPIPLPVDSLQEIHPGKMWVRKLLKGKSPETL